MLTSAKGVPTAEKNAILLDWRGGRERCPKGVAQRLARLRKAGLSPILANMSSNPISQGPALQACGVVKTYGGSTILAGIDLEVAMGASFGLLGLNGAG